MITIQEIRKRQETPYAYEMPYYRARGASGYPAESKSYYDVHGGNIYDDINMYLSQLPQSLQTWIGKRVNIALDSAKIEYVTTDAIFAYIDIAHFNYYGYFAE